MSRAKARAHVNFAGGANKMGALQSKNTARNNNR